MKQNFHAQQNESDITLQSNGQVGEIGTRCKRAILQCGLRGKSSYMTALTGTRFVLSVDSNS